MELRRKTTFYFIILFKTHQLMLFLCQQFITWKNPGPAAGSICTPNSTPAVSPSVYSPAISWPLPCMVDTHFQISASEQQPAVTQWHNTTNTIPNRSQYPVHNASQLIPVLDHSDALLSSASDFCHTRQTTRPLPDPWASLCKIPDLQQHGGLETGFGGQTRQAQAAGEDATEECIRRARALVAEVAAEVAAAGGGPQARAILAATLAPDGSLQPPPPPLLPPLPPPPPPPPRHLRPAFPLWPAVPLETPPILSPPFASRFGPGLGESPGPGPAGGWAGAPGGSGPHPATRTAAEASATVAGYARPARVADSEGPVIRAAAAPGWLSAPGRG